MKRVTGLGGFFFKADEPKKLGDWYSKHLGVPIDRSYGGYGFRWRDLDNPDLEGRTEWAPFSRDTNYFDPSEKPFMFNFRVADLERLLELLEKEGIKQVGEVETFEYGKFAWIMDPEGNKVELWEPPAQQQPEKEES
ncbi:MAG: VOC family protein [Balneolaceae bacterium]|nr:VOC family protein [Balneolaceae bacterium]